MNRKPIGLVGGILTAIATSVIVWWLTSPGGIVANFLGSPDIQLLDASVDANADKAHVKIYNSGSKIAENCQVTWIPLYEYLPGYQQSGISFNSEYFILPPGQSKEIAFSFPYQYWKNHSVTYTQDSDFPYGRKDDNYVYHYPFESSFYVDCINCKPKGEMKYLTWDNLGGMPPKGIPAKDGPVLRYDKYGKKGVP